MLLHKKVYVITLFIFIQELFNNLKVLK
jgi:hypothetical protein